MHASPEHDGPADILALSTEDGRIIFYSTTNISNPKFEDKGAEVSIPNCHPLCQLGGETAGLSGRIKDFEVLDIPSPVGSSSMSLIVAACSDGSIRLWTIAQEELGSRPRSTHTPPNEKTNKQSAAKANGSATTTESPTVTREVGRLIGTYETGNRITCLKAFVMSGAPEGSFSEAEVGSDPDETVKSSDDSEST